MFAYYSFEIYSLCNSELNVVRLVFPGEVMLAEHHYKVTRVLRIPVNKYQSNRVPVTNTSFTLACSVQQ